MRIACEQAIEQGRLSGAPLSARAGQDCRMRGRPGSVL